MKLITISENKTKPDTLVGCKVEDLSGLSVEKVFDNLYPEGKPIEQWLQDLVTIPGNQLKLTIVEQLE